MKIGSAKKQVLQSIAGEHRKLAGVDDLYTARAAIPAAGSGRLRGGGAQEARPEAARVDGLPAEALHCSNSICLDPETV